MGFTLTSGYIWKDGELVTPKKLNLMLRNLVLTTPLPLVDGTVSLPGLTFINETSTGLYRIGAGDVGFSILGTKRLEITTTGVTVPNNLTVTSGWLQIGSTAAATTAIHVAISNGTNLGNCFEFGHTNPAGYRSTLGTEYSSGKNFLAFHAEAGTNINTYRTRGIYGSVLRGYTSGQGLDIGFLSNNNADNQTLTVAATFSPTGLALLGVGVQTQLTLNAAGAGTHLSGYSGTTFIYGLGRLVNGAAYDAFSDHTFYAGSTTGPRTGSVVGVFSTTGLAVTGTLSATGAISSTVGNNAAGFITTATTGWTAFRATNTGGNTYFGVEASVGGTLVAGSTAYDALIRTPSGLSISVDGGSSVVGRFSSSGLAVTGIIQSSYLTQRLNCFEEFLTNATATLAVNYNGYNGGTTQFREFRVYNGKNAERFLVNDTGAQVSGITTCNKSGQFLVSAGATTQASYMSLVNSGGGSVFGLEDSTGATFGAPAYDTILYVAAGLGFSTIIAGTGVITRVNSTGLIIASGFDLKLGRTYTAGAPAATGYITIKDQTGTTYKVLVST